MLQKGSSNGTPLFCRCSLATALATAFALPTAQRERKAAKTRSFQVTPVHKLSTALRCYRRHVFVLRHSTIQYLDDSLMATTTSSSSSSLRAITPSFGSIAGSAAPMVEEEEEEEEEEEDALLTEKVCGRKARVMWDNALGLLWDAKLCRDQLQCTGPSLFRAFVGDLRWAAAEATKRTAAERFTWAPEIREGLRRQAKQRLVAHERGGKAITEIPLPPPPPLRPLLCYMSRGYLQRGGMVNESAMRRFIRESRECGGVAGEVLDFGGESSDFLGDFPAQARAVARCQVLVGPHGAGLGHLIWMMSPTDGGGGGGGGGGAWEPTQEPEPRTVIELLGGDTQPWYYRNLASLAGLRYLRWGTGLKDGKDLVEVENVPTDRPFLATGTGNGRTSGGRDATLEKLLHKMHRRHLEVKRLGQEEAQVSDGSSNDTHAALARDSGDDTRTPNPDLASLEKVIAVLCQKSPP